ncbi:DUF302 domain-containing protein [Granulicella sp. dw_53]|uniref:DUF302 domain-containing protein n=1 Tax=Granulicella sp. dw_53 TaxID=2719792 RepID=UPI001BD6B372|nr:DUF302 domain-containing protein [Granulicella sp. dw_53]
MNSALGISTHPSPHSVPETLDRLEAILREHSITVFSRIDHATEAEKVGLHMPPTQVLIFGNPKAGTPIMLAAPLTAIDLPLKALAWQDADGKVWLSYNDPQFLRHRFNLPAEVLNGISGVGNLIQQAVA